ncbi:hypothetical protein GF345_05715 [Candidatus Woesearchaeota archaeon]|nr:hypothetical protein [Candidatus Woesearchaeota archaeon]
MEEDMLELRRRIKKRKPDFIRKDSNKKKRLEKKWVKPRGLQSKLRLQKRGHRKTVSTGYGSPNAVKFADRSGLMIFTAHNTDLAAVDPKKEGIIISGSVGLKKKIEIIKEAVNKGITMLNINDPQAFIKDKEDMVKKRKEQRDEKLKKKDEEKKKRKSESQKKEQEEEGIEKALSEEDKKEQEEKKKEEEKKERDRVLTQKS